VSATNERAAAMAAKGQSRSARLLYSILKQILVVWIHLYFRVEIIGRERLPTSGGYVIAPVHRSNLDFMLAGLPIPRHVRWMAKDSIFLGGIVDTFLYAMGSFPVNRSGIDRPSLEACQLVVRGGQPIVMFPEGRRKAGDEVVDLFDGPAFVACRQRVPLVPMGIGGSDRAMPIGSKFIFPRKIVLILGEPIYPDVPLEGRVPRPVVNATTERLRVAVQDLYDEARRRAAA
jgi:1-acyl-sn-glycerol-3-phosphate acyltransferase